jgi:hypothetical protein
MSELRNYMSECLCNNYNIKHYFNPITCEMIYYPYDTIYNSLCSDRCKYFGNENHCTRVCNFKHLKDIELPLNNDITECLIARHTTIDGHIGWKNNITSYKEPITSYKEPPIKARKISLQLYKELISTSFESYNKPVAFKHKKHIEPSNLMLKNCTEDSIKLCDQPPETLENNPPTFKSLLQNSTKVCCYYHNKYRPTEDMIEVYIDYKKVWICPSDYLCKTLTKP